MIGVFDSRCSVKFLTVTAQGCTKIAAKTGLVILNLRM